MSRHLVLLALLLSQAVAAVEPSRTITAAEWARPRSGDFVVRLPALVDLMHDYHREPDRQVLIRHPGGEEGILWAEELRAWLVALGVASAHIDLVPGADDAGAITLSLRASGEWRR